MLAELNFLLKRKIEALPKSCDVAVQTLGLVNLDFNEPNRF